VTFPERLLICTDLDRTLIPNGPAEESASAAELFARLVAQPDVALAFVSGRHRALVEAAVEEYRLPLPDYVIGDVGTTLYRVGPERSWTPSAEWERHIGADWAGRSREQLAELLADLSPLRPQEAEKQNRHKLSYYLGSELASAELEQEIERRLNHAGIRARLVQSIDDLSGKGLLDILPASASKRHAIEALIELDDFSQDGTVFCGDSGNDMAVFVSPINSVVVGNAREDIKREALARAAEAGLAGTLYVARGGFLGLNGNYRGGMLEGIAHFHPQIAGWLEARRRPAGGALA
jgi:sucrose-6F-phosphate phosphohydrolase